jgi:transposase InsO family protein
VGYRSPTVTSAAPLQFLILLVASWLRRRQGEAIEYLRVENRVLRARLGRSRLRFTDAERELLAEKGKPLGRKLLAEMASLATPETILRWYRERVAAKYDGSRRRGAPGRPAIRGDTVKLLLTMARDNPSWGYTRLRGALNNLGFDLGRSTIQRVLAEHGIEPAPLRGKTMPWKTFLKAHWGAIAAADFFSVEVLTRGGLVRYLVLFVIDLRTRRVHIAGVTCEADGEWMAQIGRNLTDAAAGPLRGFGHLIVDRDPLYTAHFRSILQAAGVRALRLPAYSPNLNAYAERFVRSIKHECLRHIIPLGERHLRAVLREFVEHYHGERNHQQVFSRSRAFLTCELRIPGPTIAHESVQDRQQLAHARRQGDLLRLAVRDEAGKERRDCLVESKGCDRCHVKDGAHGRAPAPSCPLPDSTAAVVVEWSDADERSDLLPGELAELGNERRERRRQHGTDALDRLQ